MQDFFDEVFLQDTEGFIYICTLPNSKTTSSVGERNVVTRDVTRIEEFKDKWDKEGRGLFYCVSTMQEGKGRRKDNTVECVMIHADTDAKDITVSIDEAVKAVQSLEIPPSRIHMSGRGIHSMWLFDVPTKDFARVEDMLKQLCAVVAGDPAVAHYAALLRVPESHNTKNNNWIKVEVLESNNKRYSIDTLEEWLLNARPVIVRKTNEQAESNPFLDTAAILSFRAPIDVEKRLAEMSYQGEGANSIHTTQVSVTASMLSSGADLEDVVAAVLEATKKVGEEDWDWKKEEASIRRMCVSWQKKQDKQQKVQIKASVDSSAVVSLSQERSHRAGKKESEKEKGEKKPKGPPIHLVLGPGIVKSLRDRDEDLLFTDEYPWHFQDGLWKRMNLLEIKDFLSREAETGCRALSVHSTQKIISETRSWVSRAPNLYRSSVQWDSHGKIPTKSGLLDPLTLELTPLTPDDYATYQIPCRYDPDKECPHWEQMLWDMFPNNQETIDIIQELFGVALLDKKPRTLMRALVLVGPSNSGKSNVLNVVGDLLTDKVNSTPFEMLENAHGKTEFARRAPWILHEAFDQSKWHFSAEVKALLSGDDVLINLKNGPVYTRRFTSPVFWGTNSPPQFKEASRAIENRLVIINCHVVFDTKSRKGIAEVAHQKGFDSPYRFVVTAEREGILNWAIKGMKRAIDRGHLLDTKEIREATHQMRLSSNLVAGFLEDACEYTPDYMVSKQDFRAAFSIWWQEHRGEERNVPSADALSKAITAMYDARIIHNHADIKINNLRYYAGIRLNETGIDLWTANFNSVSVKGSPDRISDSPEKVNVKIPERLLERPLIQKMRKAHDNE